jgi:hypothetical protein
MNDPFNLTRHRLKIWDMKVLAMAPMELRHMSVEFKVENYVKGSLISVCLKLLESALGASEIPEEP